MRFGDPLVMDDPQRESALDTLEEIHNVLVRTTRYTHVSAVGVILAGVTGALAAVVGWALDVTPLGTPGAFLLLWGAAFHVALGAGLATSARRARQRREPLWNRKLQFVLVRIFPSFVVGLVFTTVLAQVGRLDLAPGMWLGLYGLGILSVSIVLDWEYQLTAWGFVVAGTAALFLLRSDAHLALGAGFGVLHIALGSYRLARELQWKRLPRSHSFKS